MKIKIKNQSKRLEARKPIGLLVGYWVFCCILVSSCEKVPELTHDILVENLSIELEDVVVGDDTKSSKSIMHKDGNEDSLNYFEATQQLIFSVISGFSEEVLNYQSQIIDVKAEKAFIIITADDEGTIVKNFVLEAVEIKTLNIDKCELGSAYTENVEAFATAVMLKLLSESALKIKISGKTDVVFGKNLKITILLENIILTAKLSE